MPELIDVEPGSPDWLAARRLGVTATDIPAICGLVSWDSPYSLYHRKLGTLPDNPDNARLRLGSILEPYIAGWWLDAHPQAVMYHGGLFRSTDRPWQMATPDRVQVDEPLDGTINAVLECKTSATRDEWGDDGTDIVPVHVRAQVLWQMDVLGVATGHVACLFLPSGELRSYVIGHAESEGSCTTLLSRPHSSWGVQPPECQACGDITLMRDMGDQFMLRLSGALPPPDVDASAATMAAVKARFAPVALEQAEVPPDLWAQYDHERDLLAVHKTAARLLEAAIRDHVGTAGVLAVGGEVVARRQRYTVRQHVRKESTVDKIVRVKAKEEDDDGAQPGEE